MTYDISVVVPDTPQANYYFHLLTFCCLTKYLLYIVLYHERNKKKTSFTFLVKNEMGAEGGMGGGGSVKNKSKRC